jgi:starvation-inducible outer membrane lipoprotein
MSLVRGAMPIHLGLLALLSVLVSGCINLPPALERELQCPAANQPDNFGAHASCESASSSR